MMKKNFKYITSVIIVLLLFVAACGGSKTTKKINNLKNPPVNTGRYDFALYDTLSFKLAEGTMDIKSTKDSRLQGEYNVTNQYVDDMPGELQKSGEFEGQYSLEESKISFNMNPKIADANIFMYGTIYKDSITGIWNFSTMRGVTEKGEFKAFYRGDEIK